jgi:xanthine dehydrogenase YagR molybdenum-binding subunit
MVTFILNGTSLSTDRDVASPLVDLIREDARLTGTKLACGAGTCGACTVHLDGAPVVSCLTPVGDADGCRITTIEALGGSDLHPVQRAMIAHDALQCGYCTPGFAMAAAAFHDAHRSRHGTVRPDLDVVGHALAGHLCRCGAYPAILRAVAEACTGAFDALGRDAATARVEARAKVTGAAVYTVDVRHDGQLEGAILRTPHAHAVVSDLDLRPAEAMPGVRAAVSLLRADRTVRFVGQEIAAVAAVDAATARKALDAIRYRLTPKPAVFDMASARERASPLVYPGWSKPAPNASEGAVLPMPWSGNVRGPAAALSVRGRAAQRLVASAADAPRRAGGRYATAGQSHTALEPHAALARFDGHRLTVHASTQGAQHLAEAIRKRFKLEDVTVIAEHVGGGFGAKVSMGTEVHAAIVLARAAGAPVRVVLDRAEELTVAGHRPETDSDVALIVGRDGGLEALTLTTWSNAGIAVNNTVAGLARLMYAGEAKALADYDVVTNLPPGSPFRGPGGAPMAFALEQAIDDAAVAAAIDPLALRRRWDVDPNRRRLYDWATTLDVWRERAAMRSDRGRYRRGVGAAAGFWLYFNQPDTEVEVAVRGGRLVVSSAAQDMGQGARSVLAHTVARAFEMAPGDVEVRLGRSDLPRGPVAAGSRSTASLVPAAQAAAERLKARLRSTTRGRVGDNAPWPDILAAAPDMALTADRPPDRDGAQADAVSPLTSLGLLGSVFDFVLRRFAHLAAGRGTGGTVQVAEVEVDTRLGRTRVVRYWSGLAVGRVQVPALARSQAEGSIIQGLGYALTEARIACPATGRIVSASLDDYRIPGIADTPEIHVHFDEDGFDHVPGGGVGIGEVATVPVAATIATAIRHATGVRCSTAPITPQRLLAGLEGRAAT